MDAAYNFSLGLTHGVKSKTETPARSPIQQKLQEISTGISLVSLSFGFSIFGAMIIANRHQADLNDLSGGRSVAMLAGIGAILVGTAFLVAACLHWRRCVRRSAGKPRRCQCARLTFSRPEPAAPIAVLY
jgi:NhaP-type Na+/H+ or K+/H+ antiporter